MSRFLNLTALDSHFAILNFDQIGSKVNVLSTPMWLEFEEILTKLAERSDLQGVILQSTKPGIFIAGADLKELENASPENLAPTRAYLELGHRVLRQLESLHCPTVAIIDGVCLGGGFEVALACDFRLVGSHPKVQIGFPEVNLGLLPGWGGTQRIARLRGPMEALRYVCSMVMLNAEQASAEGVAMKMVPSEQLLENARSLLIESRESGSWLEQRRIKQEPWHDETMPPPGINAEKMLHESMTQYMEQLPGPARGPSLEAVNVIFQGSQRPFEEGLRLETEAFLRLAGSLESRTMIEEFFARKKK